MSRNFSLRALMATTALGGALGVSALPAAAQDCGAPVNGVVTCTPAGSPYGDLSYTNQTDLTLQVEAGVDIGALQLQGSGVLTVQAGEGSSFSGSALRPQAVSVTGDAGPVTVAVDKVSSTAANAIGVIATAAGDVSLTVNTTDVTGQRSNGIVGRSTAGSVSIEAGTVTQASDSYAGYGISAIAAYDVTIDVDTVSARQIVPTVSNGVIGIYVNGGGQIRVDANAVSASGFDARGLAFDRGGDVVVNVGSIAVEGQLSRGITFGGVTANPGFFNTLNATVGDVTIGAGGVGVRIYGGARDTEVDWANDLAIGSISGQGGGVSADVRGVGNLRVQTGTIDVAGRGIEVFGSGNTALIESGSIRTSGGGSQGVLFSGRNSGVTVLADTIETSGVEAQGVFLEFTGEDTKDSLLQSGSISTAGDQAAGIRLTSYDENGDPTALVTVVSQAISTLGFESHGVHSTYVGDVRIEAADIETHGESAIGILVQDADDVVIESGSVVTEADGAVAIQVLGGDEASISSDSVTTLGDGAHGIEVAEAIHSRIDSGSIQTSGDDSYGINVRYDDTTEILSDVIRTSGIEAYGIGVDYVDAATIVSESVTTDGEQSDAISVLNTRDVKIVAEAVTTNGEDAIGVDVASAETAVLDLGVVKTTGKFSNAIRLGGDGGQYAVTVDEATTSGVNADAILLAAGAADYTLAIGSLTTSGASAYGITNYGDAPNSVALVADSIATTGAGSMGVYLAGATLDLKIQSLDTQGDEATGLYLAAQQSADVLLGSVKTAGDDADGVVLGGLSAAYKLKAGTIATSGDSARGVVLGGGSSSSYVVDLGTVTTTGEAATGVTTSLSGLSNNSESLTLRANTISTAGDNAMAAYLYAQTLDVGVAAIATTGDQATGAFLNAYGHDDSAVSDIVLKGAFGTIDTSGDGSAGLIVQSYGAVDLALNAVHTRGAESEGLRIQSNGGGVLKVGALKTEGDFSYGANLVSNDLGFDATFNAIETTGMDSDGVLLEAVGNSTVTVGSIRTTGARADGVVAATEGDLTIKAQDIRLTGDGAEGVVAQAADSLTLTLGTVDVAGSEADAVRAEAGGAVNMTASGRLKAAHGAAADLTGATAQITLASTAVVEGEAAGLRLATETGATIANSGSISSLDGFAIDVASGKVTLNNAGVVAGRVRFGSGDDVVSNSGRFMLDGVSAFGAGNDLFTNTGRIDLAAGTSARTVEFAGLERLVNAGAISLANGVGGDVFTLSGVLEGQGANVIALDLDLRSATPVADRIVAGGFAGLSHIVLNVLGDQKLGDAGVVVAQSATAQTGAEIDVSVAGGGFVDYSLALVGADYRLNAELALPAFEPTKIASGAQAQWTSGADAVSARLEQSREDGGRSGEGVQVWSQVFGGSADVDGRRTFDLDGETVEADLTHEVRSNGVQAGIDQAAAVSRGSLILGVLSSSGETELRFQNGDRTRYKGVGAGGYGQWTVGRFSVGGLAKLEYFDLHYDWAAAGMRTGADGSTVGLRVDTAYRLPLGGAWFVEPQGSVSWAETSLDRIGAETGDIEFGRVRSLIGKLGLRAGGSVQMANGFTVRPYAAIHGFEEFEGDNATTLHLASESIAIRDEARGRWGRATLGASVGSAHGLGGFVQAEQDFGAAEGFTARAGIRYAW